MCSLAGWKEPLFVAVLFASAIVGLLPHVGHAEETVVTAEEIRLGIVGQASSLSSGRVKFTAFFVLHPDRRLENPDAFAKEVEKRLRRHLESMRRTGLAITPASAEVVRQEIKISMKSGLKKSEFRKDGTFIWSGDRFRADADDYIRPELYTGPHVDIAHSSLTWNGERGAYYTSNIVSPGFRGSIESKIPQQRNETSRQHPTLWILRWTEDQEFSDADLVVESSEERFGKIAYWVSRPDRNERALICPELGYMALEYVKFYDSSQNQANIVRKVEQITEYNGHFFPREYTSVSYREDGSLWGDHRFVIEGVVLNEPIDESEFEANFPAGTMVTDLRLDPPLSYTIGVTEEAEEAVLGDIDGISEEWQPIPGTKTREAVIGEYEDTTDIETSDRTPSGALRSIQPLHVFLCLVAVGFAAFGGFWFAKRKRKSDES